MNAKSILLIALLLALCAASINYGPDMEQAQGRFRAKSPVDYQAYTKAAP